MALWTGLGFYRRAKNIYKTKEIIKHDYKNIFPKKFEELIALPGIGKSTAGAIMSLAYQESYPILDANVKSGEKTIYLSPRGKVFNSKLAREFSNENSINLICGHFEGVDERILESRNIEEISIGDFILSGGEVAAFVVIDSILRFIPGILGNLNSSRDESFENGLLEYPQFTKPQIWEEKKVPNVLISGDHAKIKDWRLSQSEAITRDRRPDLWQKYKKN